MKYVTIDGKEFDTAKEARAHERSLKPAGRRSRNLDALPPELVKEAFENLDSDFAKQLVTLGSQIRDARAKAGLTKHRNRKLI